MKYINTKNVKFSNPNVEKKKSKLWKWLKRIAFFIFLFLLFLEFNHIHLALDTLQHINTDQLHQMDLLQQKVSSLQDSNAFLNEQLSTLKVKINNVEIQNLHDLMQNNAIHTDIHQVNTVTHHENIHNSSSMISTGVGIAVTTGMAALTILKGLTGFLPIVH